MSTIAQEIEKLNQHNRQFFSIAPRKIVVSRAGGFVKARFEGRKAFVFGCDARHAVSRLKTWDGGGQ